MYVNSVQPRPAVETQKRLRNMPRSDERDFGEPFEVAITVDAVEVTNFASDDEARKHETRDRAEEQLSHGEPEGNAQAALESSGGMRPRIDTEA